VSQVITANEGDTLCGLAIRHGFFNCTPLRDDPANRAVLKRPLVAGDQVTIPDRRDKSEVAATDATHQFVRKRIPEPSLRFVHGSPDKHFEDDDALGLLNISNFRTDKAGSGGTAAFGAGFGFDQTNHADPDSFKVEAVSPDREGQLSITLEALRQVLAADGSVTGHESFDGADAGSRQTLSTARLVTRSKHRFRTNYLRAVSDEADLATKPTQCVLVADSADGSDGDADKVEILGQAVKASFTPARCAAPAAERCVVSAQLVLGEQRRRVRLAVHVFRATVGGTAVGGLTEAMVRRRIFKWFRRAYAQANVSVRLDGPGIEFIDPPAANMLTISQDTGRSASGRTSGGAASHVEFDVFDVAVPAAALVHVNVPLAAALTPKAIGDAISAALPAVLQVQVEVNPCAFNAPRGSCDVIVTAVDGRRLIIRNERSTDTRATVVVARVNLSQMNVTDQFNNIIPGSIEHRRVLRSAESADDRLDYFVVNSFRNPGLRGIASVPASDLGAKFQPTQPLRWAVVMAATSSSGPVMDSSDNLPFTFPHEAGHVLNDAFHSDNGDANGPTQLMSGTGTSVANGVNATKRIADLPVHVRYAFFNPVQATPGAVVVQRIVPVERMRTRGAQVMEDF
jgi:hypothetical protein